MKRIFLRLAVSLVTFTIGLSATAIHWLYGLPDASLPMVTTISTRSSCFPGFSVPAPKPGSQTHYFPFRALSYNEWSSQFLNGWYSRQLKAMNELPLSALEKEDESYRFLWLRSFHKPVVIHVGRTGDRHFMVVKRLNGLGGYYPGTFDLYWARPLSENDWNAFMIHLEHSTYWKLPTYADFRSTDGAQWIMEGYREGRYHIVDRQSPDAGAYRDACLFLLRQSGLLAEIPTKEVY